MVRKYDRHGNPYHEPPYTAAEEMETYRRMSGVVAYTRVVTWRNVSRQNI